MELTFEEQEMLKYFFLRCIPDFYSEKYVMNFLKFSFKEEDCDKIMAYLNTLREERKAILLNLGTYISNRTIMVSEFDGIFSLLEKLRKEWTSPKEGDIYIRIPDYKEFFRLLYEVITAFEQNSDDNVIHSTDLLHSLWLRMGPTDIEDVFTFLKRQIAFIKNDYKFKTRDTVIGRIGEFEVSFENAPNENCFETNRHLSIRLKIEDKENKSDLFTLYKCYSLPVIHYGLAMEEEPTCYIYGIQRLDKYNRNEEVEESLKPYKRRLRNKYVSADSIIALKIAIDLLKAKGITCIKVPLLQVYNYKFHQNLGEKAKRRIDAYSPELLERIENMEATDALIDRYNHDKDEYERFYNKENIISENKTKRLFKTFELVSEFYGNIEIPSESFEEGDCLLFKIKQPENNKTL